MYKSTRSDAAPITASAAILKGLADDGGLFVPTVVPALDRSFEELAGMNYKEVAYEVMKLVLTDFTQEELRGCIDKAYGENFDTAKIAPIKDESGTYFMELFHGPTIAFKDMALQILPHLMTTAAKKNHLDRKIVILTATSGDTGKAALAGFAGVPDTKIVVFYPKDGVSAIHGRGSPRKNGSCGISVLLRKLDQYRPSRATDCLLCLGLYKASSEPQNQFRR